MNKYIWLIPFISFLTGYFIMTTLYKERVIDTPNLIGLSIQEALVKINSTDQGLSIRLIAEKENSELPSGTIIEQSPKPLTKIKSHQHIACIVSKAPSKAMPTLIGKKTKDIKQELDNMRMNGKIYYLVSKEPIGTCIAQDPAPETPISGYVTTTIYMSKGTAEAYMLPNLVGLSSKEAHKLLATHGIAVTTMHITGDHTGACDDSCIVTEHWPKAGSILQPNTGQHDSVSLSVSRPTAAPELPVEHQDALL